MSKDNGGPAFPVMDEHEQHGQHYGMTMRDYFAAKAMQGMSANPFWNDEKFERIAEAAYAQADAILAERDKEQGE